MTFDEWKATRVAWDDIGEYIGEESVMGIPGFLYADFMYIAKSERGDYWTIADRDEYSGTLEECEIWLWRNYADNELNR